MVLDVSGPGSLLVTLECWPLPTGSRSMDLISLLALAFALALLASGGCSGSWLFELDCRILGATLLFPRRWLLALLALGFLALGNNSAIPWSALSVSIAVVRDKYMGLREETSYSVDNRIGYRDSR